VTGGPWPAGELPLPAGRGAPLPPESVAEEFPEGQTLQDCRRHLTLLLRQDALNLKLNVHVRLDGQDLVVQGPGVTWRGRIDPQTCGRKVHPAWIDAPLLCTDGGVISVDSEQDRALLLRSTGLMEPMNTLGADLESGEDTALNDPFGLKRMARRLGARLEVDGKLRDQVLRLSFPVEGGRASGRWERTLFGQFRSHKDGTLHTLTLGGVTVAAVCSYATDQNLALARMTRQTRTQRHLPDPDVTILAPKHWLIRDETVLALLARPLYGPLLQDGEDLPLPGEVPGDYWMQGPEEISDTERQRRLDLLDAQAQADAAVRAQA